MKLRFKAYLFDMDGVVLNSMPYHVKAWQEAFQEFGLTVSPNLLYLYEGAIEPDTAVQLFCNNGCTITKNDFEKILARQKQIFQERYRVLVSPYPEIPEILSTLLGMDASTALVTSSHREILNSILPKEILAYFNCVITGDSVERRKPYPDPYLKAIEALGATPDEAVAIENAPSGILSAKQAGASCIAIKTTLDEQHLQKADMVVEDHRELKSAICHTE